MTLLFLGVISLFIDMPEVNFRPDRPDLSLPALGRGGYFRAENLSAPDGNGGDFYVYRFDWLSHASTRITILSSSWESPSIWKGCYWTFASYWRLMAMLFGTIQYFSTNRERETLVAIRTLKAPFVVTYFFSLALRSAGMFLEDMHIIREAERARGWMKSRWRCAIVPSCMPCI